MNIINQEREDIIANNNTAQSQLADILERIKSSGKGSQLNELMINETLYGTVDFSILEDYGLKNIKTINFQSGGRVVEITHLPKNLTHLYCSKQLLVELAVLPHQLEVLECNDNYLEKLDLEDTPKLKILHCSNNRLHTLENIPPLTEEIICNNNEIRRLDLRTAEKLRILHCSNNRTIILEGFPPSVVDFQSENNPLFDPLHFCKTEGELIEMGADDADATETKINYKEGLYEYFKIKEKYEKQSRNEKHRVFEKEFKKTGSRKMALKKTRTIIPPCINCGRRVGTLFSFKGRAYKAMCGDTSKPCNLKITLNAGTYDYDINTVLELTHYSLERVKTEIIKQKMETVLDYIKPEKAKDNYKKLINEFNETAKEYEETVKKYNETVYGDIRRKCIQEKQIRVYEIISQVDLVLKEYDKTQNPEILRTAVQIQVQELFPEIHNLHLLKNDVNEINIITDLAEGWMGNTEPGNIMFPVETSFLFQKILSLEKYERVINGENPEIVNFIYK